MIVNKRIREALNDISLEAIKLGNTSTGSRRYVKVMVKLFDTKLTEEERIFMATCIFRELSYKYMEEKKKSVLIGNIRKIAETVIYVVGGITGSLVLGVAVGGEELLDYVVKILFKLLG